MNTKTKIERRRQQFVDPDVQGALVRRIMLHGVLVMLVLFGGLLAVQGMQDGFDKPMSQQVQAVMDRHGVVLSLLMCLMPVVIADLIRLSHRMVGPVYSMRETLHKLSRGERVEELRFRKGDFWSGMASDMNRLARRMDESDIVSSRAPVIYADFDERRTTTQFDRMEELFQSIHD